MLGLERKRGSASLAAELAIPDVAAIEADMSYTGDVREVAQPTAMTTIVQALETFCQHRKIPRPADAIRAVAIEAADGTDMALLDPLS